MAYVSGFNNDIFVSYASVDNEPDAQDVRWVSRFRNDLETALRRRLGKDVVFFFDQAGLHAYHHLDELLRNARDSALFLAVFSPSYAEREWTRDELTTFFEAARKSGEPNRIVTIEILPVEPMSLPLEIEHLKRTRFYTKDKDSGTDLPLTPASQPGLYNERVQQLAHQLVQIMREMRQKRESAAKPQGVPAPGQVPAEEHKAAPTVPAAVASEAGTTLLLAQVGDDVYNERQKVASYLEDLPGVRILPAGEYPQAGSRFARAVMADIQQAHLFVQLLGSYRTFKPEDLRLEGDAAKSYAQFQYDAARRRGIPVLQWRHPDNSPDKQQAFNYDRQLLEGPDVRVMGLQEFMKEVRSTIGRLNQKEEPKPPPGDFIFINADRSDQDLAQALLKAFNDNNRYAVLPMHADAASAKEIEEDLEANLIDCKGLLLVYGKASLAWLRAQIRRFIKLESRREVPLRFKTILYGPPPQKPEHGVSGFETKDWQDGTTEQVQKIVKELRL
jgi:hypothetical protein